MLDILRVVNNDKDLDPSNIFDKIQKAISTGLSTIQIEDEYDQLQKDYRSWKEADFSFNHEFGSLGTLLHIAARSNYVNVIKSMVEKYEDINIKEKEHGKTPLHEAAALGNIESVKALIGAGANVEIKDKLGCTPLHPAAKYGHTEVVKTLIEAGAKVNIKDKLDCTPLHEAVQCRSMFNTLIFLTKSINTFRDNKNISSHNNEHIDTVRALLQAKETDVNAAGKKGVTSLHLAIAHGCADVVKVLLQEKGIDVNTVDENGATSLHLAALLGDIDKVKILLEAKGIDVNAADKKGVTPLHLAAIYGHTDVVKVLLKAKGINVNAVDENGCTPLLMRLAATNTIQYANNVVAGINVDIKRLPNFLNESSSKEIINILMTKGADHLFKNKDGMTSMDFDENGYVEQFLKRKALMKSFIFGCSTAVLGSAAAYTFFATGIFVVNLLSISSAVAIVTTTALVAGYITYEMFRPSTKVEGVKPLSVVEGGIDGLTI